MDSAKKREKFVGSDRLLRKQLRRSLSLDAELLSVTQKCRDELAKREKKRMRPRADGRRKACPRMGGRRTKQSPSYDESLVQKHNQIIADWLDEHSDEIKQGNIRVLVEDECHLKGGDLCGRGWANRKQRQLSSWVKLNIK